LFLPPPTVAAYFLDANNDGNPVAAEPRVIFTLNGNCAEMSDIIVDLEERVAWHWPNLMHLETTLRLLSLDNQKSKVTLNTADFCLGGKVTSQENRCLAISNFSCDR
jgi:hypothetical protein